MIKGRWQNECHFENPNEPSVARGDYVFDSDHMFFSDYSKRLTESLDEINWTEVLLLSKELLSAKLGAQGFFLNGGVRQTQITLPMI